MSRAAFIKIKTRQKIADFDHIPRFRSFPEGFASNFAFLTFFAFLTIAMQTAATALREKPQGRGGEYVKSGSAYEPVVAVEQHCPHGSLVVETAAHPVGKPSIVVAVAGDARQVEETVTLVCGLGRELVGDAVFHP